MDEITKVAFPGLGIGIMEFNKVALSFFGVLEIRWYALCITLGIVIAFLHTVYRGKKDEGIVPDNVMDVGLATVVLGIIGARLYYVLTTLDTAEYNSFWDVIAIWNGGIGIYGGIIGGCIGILGVCLWKKINWRKMFDMIAPGVIIAQSLGRWGNFFNGEAHGYAIGETTRFDFFHKSFQLPSGEGTLFHLFRMDLGEGICYHPTFLYESVWNLCGFILLTLLYRKKKFDGQVALMYFAWYGFGRMFIEGMRSDSLWVPGTQIRISQLVGLFTFLISVGLLTYFLIKKRNDPPVLALAGNAPVETAAEVTEEGIEEVTEEPTEEATEETAEETTEAPEEAPEEPGEEENNGNEN